MRRLWVALALASCTDDDRMRVTLEKQGFTEIRTTGFAWWSCSDDDHFATGFTAKNPQGKVVSGAVCCGLVKNCTVRW